MRRMRNERQKSSSITGTIAARPRRRRAASIGVAGTKPRAGAVGAIHPLSNVIHAKKTAMPAAAAKIQSLARARGARASST